MDHKFSAYIVTAIKRYDLLFGKLFSDSLYTRSAAYANIAGQVGLFAIVLNASSGFSLLDEKKNFALTAILLMLGFLFFLRAVITLIFLKNDSEKSSSVLMHAASVAIIPLMIFLISSIPDNQGIGNFWLFIGFFFGVANCKLNIEEIIKKE